MRKAVVVSVVAVGVVAAWLLFRPELLFITSEVNDVFPTAHAADGAAPVALASGAFHGVAHETKGTATIYRLADGKRVLRLTDFATSNGPDVRVYLGMARDATDSATVKEEGFVNVGALKGTNGDQNYELPADADLARFHSVTIWCQRFGVNFGTAPLSSGN